MIQASPASGLLPALIAYYQRLEADPNRGVADFGFSVQKIHAQVVLEADGTLVGLEDVREQSPRGKPAPRSLLVPDAGGRSGTGLKPSFCWDNTGYALGRDTKGNPGRATEMFEAFRDFHLSSRDELADDEGFAALCRFLERWDPAGAESLPNWAELAGLNVVYKLRGRAGYVHQGERVRAAWLRRSAGDAEDGPRTVGRSLVDGESDEIARLHPAIKGVVDANTTGAAIVSFNLNAFESYGKSQSFNAPVGVRDAFRYTTALNRLLADDARRVRIGDATVVFWSDRDEGGDAEDMFRQIFGEDAPRDAGAEHAATVDRVRGFLEAARQGRPAASLADPDAPFYILGLSPNASRLNVRFWLAGTVRDFAMRLAEHARQLEMTGTRPDDPPLIIRRLLLETARESKDIPPQLAGEVARAVLDDLPYPRALFDAVVRRVRIEAIVTHVKAAILKAHLLREGITIMESTLNRQHPEPAYHCGRMLALLAFAQETGLESVNAGVARRNMGAAMATPGLVLGRLLRSAEVGHLPKLEGQIQPFVRDELQAISVSIGDRIPVTLDLVKQGIFALGFYQEQSYLNEAKEAVKKGRLHRSGQGEWMASRLEVRVADSLARAKVRYVYEARAILRSGQERWPDFFIEGTSSPEHIYLEVLGYSSPEYDKRWISKRDAYRDLGITPGGGSQGRLVVLDWRDQWGPDPKSKPNYPSDAQVYDLLRPFLPGLATIDQELQNAEASNS